MTYLPAEIRVKQEPYAWVIQISGDLTQNESELLQPARPWEASGAPVAGTIVFDLASMNYCNSAGIALLIRYVREATHHGYKLAAFGVSSHYQKIFRIVGLTHYLELFPDKYSVIETLQARAAYGE